LVSGIVPRPRIESLTDLIFGLALSISAIALIGTIPGNHLQFIASVAFFGFSFLILMNIWVRYTTIVSLVPIETSGMMRLNIVLLFLVAVEPYLFNSLLVTGGYAGFGQDASTGLSLDLGGMTLIIAYFAHVLTREKKGLVPRELLGQYRMRRNFFVLAGAIFLFSTVPQFWVWMIAGEPVRVWMWLATFPVSWARNLSSSKNKPVAPEAQPDTAPEPEAKDEDFTKKWLG